MKKIKALLCALFVFSLAFGQTAVSAFSDVPETSVFYDDILYVTENGIMRGSGADTFAPQEVCTRIAVAVALNRMAGSPSPKGDGHFEDIDKDCPCYDAVTWGAETGLLKGVSENSFEPKGSLTREQFVTFLFRYAEFKGAVTEVENTEALSSFNDYADVSDWAVNGFAWAVENGEIYGTEDNRLDPKSEVTREQTAAVIARFMRSLVMSYADFKALPPESQKMAFSSMSGMEIYELVSESDENWPVTAYDLISPSNAKETIVLYDNNGDLHFNLAWPVYGGFEPITIASISELSGTLDVSRDGGDGGYSLTYGKNEDGSYPNDSQRSVPKSSATVRTGTLDVDKYKKAVDTITEAENEDAAVTALVALGYTEEIASRLVSDYGNWFKRDEVSGPDNISDGAKTAGHEVESKYGYYGKTAPWTVGGLSLEGGAGQLSTVFSWGALCASEMIYDTATAEIK
ncbi:MAG: S-layer homology domain-containing protein [Clostridia bacterium]|nr:S-layer homology domain-containing protein [Clostridia bacterium]